MIELDVQQGTRAWIEARLGIPTASEVSRIVTPTGKLSTSRDGYLAELTAEFFLGEPVTDFSNDWTERGQVLEPEAFDYYTFRTDSEPRKTGIIFHDDDYLFGGSPDGLCDPDGGLELKCPSPGIHLTYLARKILPRQYVGQVQACLWLSQRKWWDFLSYHPGLPPFLIRVEPDPAYQAALDRHIPVFIDELLEMRKELIENHGMERAA